ncbi:4Fe-4S dicluster domain-containing protein [Fusibacter paucivorans]|uniref:4Fe-4S dicluster domain-containing protein n=1 Tax=Fusibacter paucivorans TaxID=76009 RepID=A0ABS5PTM7_9FIRM|nr:pyridine nucleotide-disulfide oxidoreductase/dicluster-binding protein [Fusibacter paucivorans]MBS7528438.1 4Fe-4S dicluster domain-containing protein [Fusibacter paucivorans]
MMNQQELRARESLCTQEHPPKCAARCPVHVDVRTMISSIQKGDIAAAMKVYQKAIAFPNIVSHLCDAPCQSACVRTDIDEGIHIQQLEKYMAQAMVDKARGKSLKPPSKGKSVAVIGSGLSGLTATKLLGSKGYRITIFEREEAIGGRLRAYDELILPKTMLLKDLESLAIYDITIKTQTTVNPSMWSEIISTFDAVYLDISKDAFEACVGAPFEAFTIDAATLSLNATISVSAVETVSAELYDNVFAGGSLYRNGDKTAIVDCVSDGKMVTNTIDRYLQNVSLTANRTGEGPIETQLYTDLEDLIPEAAITPANFENGYTANEAQAEAARCLLCECLACVKNCVYMQHYKSYPKRYFREIYNNLSIVMGIHHANKMINTCSLCGLCETICPNDASMRDVVLEARQQMVSNDKMPPSAHDFALRDMAFSTGDQFALFKRQQGFERVSHVFFPGCQLSGSSPEHILTVYPWLCDHIETGVGLMLDCCGAPALWAGRESLFSEQMDAIRSRWDEEGRPVFITACPSCMAMFKEAIPEMTVVMLYEVLAAGELPSKASKKVPQTFAIHDSCSTRHETALQNAVRKLASDQGHTISELKFSRDKTKCCGFGGLMMFADKTIANAVIADRAAESPEAYITYCAMCRDNFLGQSKPTYHILDILFGDAADDLTRLKPPDFSMRHENRAKLKRKVLSEFWGECVDEPLPKVAFTLAEGVRDLMAERNILLEDIEMVLAHVKMTGNKIWHAQSGLFMAYYQPSAVTYWVAFEETASGYHIKNAYSHRLTIEI